MTRFPPLYLLRHGQTDWNRDRRVQGQQESQLTELGQMQARAQGRILARLDLPDEVAVFASPLKRTRQTAALALGPLGFEPEFDDRLKEVAMGAWEGRMWDDLLAEQGGQFDDRTVFDLCVGSPGESLDMLAERIGDFLSGLTRPTVIVSHGIALSVLRGLVLGLDRDGMAATDRRQGVVTEIRDRVQRVLTD